MRLVVLSPHRRNNTPRDLYKCVRLVHLGVEIRLLWTCFYLF